MKQIKKIQKALDARQKGAVALFNSQAGKNYPGCFTMPGSRQKRSR